MHTFEIVFACVEGRQPNLEELRAFLWRPADPRNVEELTDEQVAALTAGP